MHEIERWALRVIDAIVADRPSEDARVEAKRQWPESGKMARRLAGHANAARGAPILWVIGVDEKARKVVGAERRDAQEWYPQLESMFDGPAPALVDLVVPYADKVVMGLFFETTRAPYVVRTAAPKPGEAHVAFEVPWRAGTTIRTARREELLRILIPATVTPTCDIQRALLLELDSGRQCRLMVNAFLIHESGRAACIPFRGMRLEATAENHILLCDNRVRLDLAQTFENVTFPSELASHSVKIAAHEAIVSASGMIVVTGQSSFPKAGRLALSRGPIHIALTLPVVGGSPIEARATLNPAPSISPYAGTIALWDNC